MEGLNKIKYQLDENSICSICLEKKEVNSNVFSCKRCNNSFHEECTFKLIKYKNECPLCRYKISELVIIDPEIILFSRNIMMYHNSALQFIIFMNLIRSIFFTFLVILSLFLLYFIFL